MTKEEGDENTLRRTAKTTGEYTTKGTRRKKAGAGYAEKGRTKSREMITSSAKASSGGARLGSGERFAKLESAIAGRPGFKPRGGESKAAASANIAAFLGRKKYGTKKMAQLSAKGRKR